MWNYYTMKKTLFVILLLLSFVCNIKAQQMQARLDHYSTTDGLPSNSISDIIQDKFGYIWIATWNGLSRFDGYNFQNYATGKASGIKNFHNRILELETDLQGNIWMIMYDNRIFVLNRFTDCITNAFDGIKDCDNMKIYDTLTENKFKISNALTISPDGNVYIIIPHKGIYQIYINKKTHAIRKIFDNKRNIYNMACDAYGNLWLGTKKGLIMVDKNTGRTRGKLMIPGEHYNTMGFVGSDLYLGTQSGKIIIRDTRKCKSKYLNIKNTSHSPITALHVDSKGLVWFTTDKQGVSMFDPTTNEVKSFTQKVSIPENDINGCTIFETGNVLWARMNHGGFGVYDRITGQMNYFYNSPKDTWNLSNTVTSYMALNEGVVWMSTIRRGLEKLSIVNNKIKLIVPKPESYEYGVNEIRAIIYDKKSKRILISNKAGEVYSLKNKDLSLSSKAPIFSIQGRIYGMMEDHLGNIWISTKGKGLYMLKYGQRKPINVNYPFTSQNIYNTKEDKFGNIWIATYNGGVNILMNKGNGKFKLITPKYIKGYGKDQFIKVRTLEIDNEGIVWAGTSDGIILLKFNKLQKSFEAHTLKQTKKTEEQMANNDIVEISKSPSGDMWIATNGGGLIKSIGKDNKNLWRFKNFGLANGLPSEELRGITFNKSGQVWFSCDQIICSYDPQKQLFTTFSMQDGVGDIACSECSAYTLPDNRMLFGTLNGYYIVDKKLLTTTKGSDFKLAITDFYVNDKLMTPRNNNTYDYYIPDSGQVKLPSRSSAFSIKFASLNYQLQHRVHYMYMLEGYDDKWLNANDKRTVSYNDVPAGEYTFRVKAFLLENPNKYDERKINIIVPPYAFASNTALWVYLIIIIGGILGGLLWRKKVKINALNRMRVLKVGPEEIAFQNNEDFDFVKSLQDWLELHYSDANVKIEDMVHMTNMSRTAFYTQLKTLTGISPKEFVSEFRLKKACMYLEKDTCTIAEVAYRTGFNDPVYFTRLFKQKKGMTPTQYRDNNGMKDE